MKITLAESDTDLDRIGDVLLQLRSAFTKETLIAQIKEQQKTGFQIVYVESEGEILCVAGFVVATKLAWGKHIYISDFVTAERHRSTGVGAKLIEWFKAHARELGCKQLHLDSGVQRVEAHRFYQREGFNLSSHHFSINDLTKE
ncbi:MAG TPA: GNAT family N-acetyltransferase [Polyangiaceae bacterium]|nr:GNAT family N-acetyltransferase [Polyangiaceae bacterium]